MFYCFFTFYTASSFDLNFLKIPFITEHVITNECELNLTKI